ncbi:MAG: 3-phosphoshikimate 1-carboxyvinyltransferase [Dehalococcoidales bacterium]|nr:3-phosphoshikimate 1-carboxyvinyltransferase [Dehalococcoidales bacterium]
MKFTLNSVSSLRGDINIPADKSLSHRAVMFNSIASGKAKISNFLMGEDCLSTIDVLSKLGVEIQVENNSVYTYGKGLESLNKPNDTLYVGNSGTTIRLMSGVLAGRKFKSILDGDSSIRKRPMKRIIDPLTMMGANISANNNNDNAPILFDGGTLTSLDYDLPVASAQLKSALILAGLRSNDGITIREKAVSRDHTERLLSAMGAKITINNLEIKVSSSDLFARDIIIPGDISSASFWLIAGAIHKNSDIYIRNVGINETRSRIISVLKRMGANMTFYNEVDYSGEPACDMNIKTSNLKGTTISGAEIPLLIDEIPIIALAAVSAEGETKIIDAKELRYKESDRISLTVNWMKSAGAQIQELDDGMIITGTGNLNGGTFSSHGDHRLAMTLGIASLISNNNITIDNAEASNVSYPSFWDTLKNLGE